MKIKGRQRDAWHKNVNDTAGLRKPTDPDFPWTALQNHTGYYLKKKGKSSQIQIDERLIALIQSHPSKEVAIAACAHSISVRAIRDLLANGLHVKPDGDFGLPEYFQVIVATNHVNPGAVSDIEAQWARCLVEHAAAGGFPHTLGRQLENMLPLLSAPVAPGQLLRADITDLANDVCRDFATQLEHLRRDHQWTDAHAAIGWLSTDSMSNMLQIPNTGARPLLDFYLPKWGAWAAWRPNVTRIRAWKVYAILAPSSLQDLFALEGPDYGSAEGSEQTTLRKGLTARGSSGSQSPLYWGEISVIFNRNPYKKLESLNDILDRLASVVDYACLAGQEYTTLLAHLWVGKGISNEALQILEGIQILGNPTFTTVILHAFTLPRQSIGQGIKEIRQLLSVLGNSRIHGLREQMKPYLVDRISNYIKELQDAFHKLVSAGEECLDAAMELLVFSHGLQEETWLLGEFDSFVQQSIASGHFLMTVEALGAVRRSIRSATSSAPTPLLGEIDTYCKACLIPTCAISPHVRDLVEALIDLWQQDLYGNLRWCRELALRIADLPNTSYQLRCDCLRDLTNLTHFQVINTLEALKTPSQSLDLGIFALIRLLASEDRPDHLVRWRQVLSFAIIEQHETLLQHAMTHLTAKMWLELLGRIRSIYKGSRMITVRGSPRLFSLELHTWSQQMADYLPTLTHLKAVLKQGPAMETLMLGSTGSKNSQLLRVLHLVQAKGSSCHEKLMDTIIAILNDGNVDEIEDVLLAVSEARPRGVEACLSVLGSGRKASLRLAAVVLASRLRTDGISEPDRLALRKVAKLFSIVVDAEGNPSTAGVKEYADDLHEQYLRLIVEAQRLEELRLSLRAVVPHEVSKLLAKLHIKAPSVVDDSLASLPPLLGSVVESISRDEIELQFPATRLTRLQRFAIGASVAESFLIRLTLGRGGEPSKFCVHLSGELGDQANWSISTNKQHHNPWEVLRGSRAPHEQYCRGRPNRGVYQLSRILWGHLRGNFESLEQTHAHITSKLSRFGQGCMVCGLGQRRLLRATICSSPSCQSTFSKAHIEIQLAEIWQDQPVMDLLLSMIHAVASTGSLDLLSKYPFNDAPAVVSMLDVLPAIPTLAKHIRSCLTVHGDKFRLAQALIGYCTLWSSSTILASGLLWACTSYRGFLVSATGIQRIPSFGNDQFLLANAAPDLEIAFSRHMLTPNSTSQILFHGTSLDRLHAILCQGLRVQSHTALQRHGAFHGAGIYMADEPSVAWGYATSSAGGWKSSKLKNMKVLLGCELAGQKPQAPYGGIYVITDATRLAVRYIFLLGSNASMPAAKDVRLPMGSVFQSLRNGTC